MAMSSFEEIVTMSLIHDYFKKGYTREVIAEASGEKMSFVNKAIRVMRESDVWCRRSVEERILAYEVGLDGFSPAREKLPPTHTLYRNPANPE